MHDAARVSEWMPPRDWPAVWGLVDRWPGLRKEHDETWLVLCQLCEPGRRGLVLPIDTLRVRLQAVRNGRRVQDCQITRRLVRLAQVGLIHWRRRANALVIGLHDPRRIEAVPVPCTPREPRIMSSGDRQRSLWQDPPSLAIFRPEVKPLSVPDGGPPLGQKNARSETAFGSESGSEFTSGPEVNSLLSHFGPNGGDLDAGPPGEPAGETPRAGAPALHSPPLLQRSGGEWVVSGAALDRARVAVVRLMGDAAAGAMADSHLADLVRVCGAVEAGTLAPEDLSLCIERAGKKPRADRLRYLRGAIRARLADRAGLPASSWIEYERVIAVVRLPEGWLERVMDGLGPKAEERGSGGAKERGTGGCTRPTPEEAAEIRSMLAEAREAMRRARADAGERQRGEGGGGT